MRILLATKNRGKIREMNSLFAGTGVEFVGTDILDSAPDVVEDGRTYHDNALKKAMTFYKLTGLPTLAEDSGLEVDALQGGPGVYSARFAGENASDEENIKKLLAELKGVKKQDRRARFVSVLCLVIDGKPHFFEGEVRGRILEEPEGRSGFGYDPVFCPDGYEHSFAVLGEEIKNSISHRARAIEKLKDFIEEILQ